MATYGEGDPTDNAQDFYDWLQENDDEDLSGLNYTVSLSILNTTRDETRPLYSCCALSLSRCLPWATRRTSTTTPWENTSTKDWRNWEPSASLTSA